MKEKKRAPCQDSSQNLEQESRGKIDTKTILEWGVRVSAECYNPTLLAICTIEARVRDTYKRSCWTRAHPASSRPMAGCSLVTSEGRPFALAMMVPLSACDWVEERTSSSGENARRFTAGWPKAPSLYRTRWLDCRSYIPPTRSLISNGPWTPAHWRALARGLTVAVRLAPRILCYTGIPLAAGRREPGIARAAEEALVRAGEVAQQQVRPQNDTLEQRRVRRENLPRPTPPSTRVLK